MGLETCARSAPTAQQRLQVLCVLEVLSGRCCPVLEFGFGVCRNPETETRNPKPETRDRTWVGLVDDTVYY